ncbi:PREDICTED: folylpolyglutamate synthase, mitochondrial-like [Atta cephalotes]|uniref:Folylpolyglutamate synthase n=1 Tax=Atta cephalotes TaxID=12957 RepID=A0A158NV37_ATTCE|nr:PREDICTED: folylpolyglutamate synthase, mitochondrial-like [Atta cephalotes]
MFTLLRRMTHNTFLSRSAHINGSSYEEAIKALSLTLQSNTTYLQSVKNTNDSTKLKEVEKYLLRSGITFEQLNSLSVIHVAGTKGKGSTCAFTEAILRQHGFSTGFFSSPHLVSVRERIRLNGEPISQAHFTHFFWNVYQRLEQKREYESDMPTYFKFLTILTFHVFLEANVDVAIIEVGIGGELDCTNILQNPICVGITSLGLEHTSLLGNTLEEIAYQKSGIFKPHTIAFTVPQPESAMHILQKRAIERKCRDLRIVSTTEDCKWNDIFSLAGIDIKSVQQQNALLSISIAHEWMKSHYDQSIINNKYTNDFYNLQSEKNDLSQIISPNKVATALMNCKWPARMQILRTSVADFFLDGAHTIESIINCISWFKRISRGTSSKFLIFNISGDRNSLELLKLLKPLNFDRVYFAPNYTGVISVEDLSNYMLLDEQRRKCKKHCALWGDNSVSKNTVAEVLYDIKKHVSQMDSHDKVEVLVTGSLHLNGAVLAILDPNLSMTSDF